MQIARRPSGRQRQLHLFQPRAHGHSARERFQTRAPRGRSRVVHGTVRDPMDSARSLAEPRAPHGEHAAQRMLLQRGHDLQVVRRAALDLGCLALASVERLGLGLAQLGLLEPYPLAEYGQNSAQTLHICWWSIIP